MLTVLITAGLQINAMIDAGIPLVETEGTHHRCQRQNLFRTTLCITAKLVRRLDGFLGQSLIRTNSPFSGTCAANEGKFYNILFRKVYLSLKLG
jgi:hypothetical protein